VAAGWRADRRLICVSLVTTWVFGKVIAALTPLDATYFLIGIGATLMKAGVLIGMVWLTDFVIERGMNSRTESDHGRMKYGAVYERRAKLIVPAHGKTTTGVLIGVPPYVVRQVSADAAEIGRTMRSVLERSSMNLRHPEPHEWNAMAQPLYDAAGAKSWPASLEAHSL